MDKDNNEAKFNIEGNPGTGNTFIHIGTAYNVNPNATTVQNTFNITTGADGESVLHGENDGKPGKKLGEKTIREMLKDDLIDTGIMQKEILNYISCIRPLVKDDLDKLYMAMWGRIVEHEAFKVDLYAPGKQVCKFNRNLIGNILHYLDGKKFYKVEYNQSEFTRRLEGDDQNAVRKALRFDPDEKYCAVVDEIIKELKEK